jgi:hypothetical protein
MPKTTERRRKSRIPLQDVLKLAWVDKKDKYFSTKAPCLDASETGLRVEIAERMDPASFVNVKADRFGLTASARVRHVVQSGIRYQIGLEFNPGHAWKNLPAAPASEPS